MTTRKALPRLVASDFYGFLRPSQCGLRIWLRAQGEEQEPPGVFAKLLMRMGIEHERRHLERFPNHVDLGPLPIAERVEETLSEIASGERVIYQGALRTEVTLARQTVEIVGVPDFMLPARRGYAIRDSKLARRVGYSHPEIRLQLETYGWLYEETFGVAPVALQVHAGSGEIVDVPYEGGEEALASLERIFELRIAEEEPTEYISASKCSGCGFRPRCWPAAVERHDVGLLPWVDRGLIAELHAHDVHTLEDLVAKFDATSLAVLDRPWGKGRKPVGDRAARILVSARALIDSQPILLSPPAIPEHETYVMFDLEGMPPRHDELEKIYIWGLQCFGAEAGKFRAATAGFGADGDSAGWEVFLREAAAIFDVHGDIPFVHWASYEKAKINLYIQRYGDRDGIAERVKRNLLDLLPITHASVAVPLSSYGLKEVETLTGYERKLEESGGAWSMARYIEATETSDVDGRSKIMGEILAYNQEDLEATWAVMKWLRGLAEDSESIA